jgi:hypothetical protein
MLTGAETSAPLITFRYFGDFGFPITQRHAQCVQHRAIDGNIPPEKSAPAAYSRL